MKPEVRVFSKENPCSKRDVWECFRGPNGFQRVQVSTAHSMIGINVPRVMERNGHLVKNATPQGDFLTLTPGGRDWLERGIRAYVRNHPAERSEVLYLDEPRTPPPPPAMQRRVRRRM